MCSVCLDDNSFFAIACVCGHRRGNRWGQWEGVPTVSPWATLCHETSSTCIFALLHFKNPHETQTGVLHGKVKWSEGKQWNQTAGGWQTWHVKFIVWFFFFQHVCSRASWGGLNPAVAHAYRNMKPKHQLYAEHKRHLNSHETYPTRPSFPFLFAFPKNLQVQKKYGD